MSLRSARLLPLYLLLSLAASCSDDGASPPEEPPQDGRVHLEITDAPLPMNQVARFIVEIDAVRVHSDADGDHGFQTIIEDGPFEVKLHGLRNGLTQLFEGDLLEPGSYRQMRIHFTSALLELKDGRIFTTEDNTLRLTGQDSAGFKIFFDPPVEVREGETTDLLLDFDLRKSVSSVPGKDTDHADFFHLHPNVRTAVLEETGEVRGVVTTTDDAGHTVPAADAEVYLLEPGESDLDQAIASTLTDENGSAAILGVFPGTYDVLAIHEGREGRADGLVVAQGAITSFDNHLEE